MARAREDRTGAGTRGRIGQQTGSKRPAERVGAAKRAPKSGEVKPKGTARRGTARKSRPGKTRVAGRAKSKKA